MNWLVGGWPHLGGAAGKAVLMYATALLALRLGERRTLAQWTIIDFATAVAMGAIIGRTAVASSQSWVVGAVAVVTLVAVHRVASLLRFHPTLGKLADHRVRVLVAHGELRRVELRRCGLTDNDVLAQLRQRGIFSLEEVRYVLYEAKGSITVVPESVGTPDPPLVDAGLEGAAGFTPADSAGHGSS
ncbi:MAG TPA: YetF domain-containing protein [Acidimicrobiales bacterium]|nr:YetF domain-containing protein [Acidimicrobiales bacterium]